MRNNDNVREKFTTLTGVCARQVFIYERGNQRMSLVAKVLVSGAWLYAIVTVILATQNVAHLKWLNFLSGLAYIKMGVTLIKLVDMSFPCSQPNKKEACI